MPCDKKRTVSCLQGYTKTHAYYNYVALTHECPIFVYCTAFSLYSNYTPWLPETLTSKDILNKDKFAFPKGNISSRKAAKA